MNKLIFFLLTLLSFNLYLSQTTQNLNYLFNGEVKLKSTTEYISTADDTVNGLSVVLNINNTDYTFLVDTGASVSILNNQTFKNENIVEPKEKIQIKDALGNEEQTDLYYLDFKIGKNQFSYFAFIKSDLSKLFKNNC